MSIEVVSYLIYAVWSFLILERRNPHVEYLLFWSWTGFRPRGKFKWACLQLSEGIAWWPSVNVVERPRMLKWSHYFKPVFCRCIATGTYVDVLPTSSGSILATYLPESSWFENWNPSCLSQEQVDLQSVALDFHFVLCPWNTTIISIIPLGFGGYCVTIVWVTNCKGSRCCWLWFTCCWQESVSIQTL